MKEIVELLKEKNMKIATMESCTGGAVANAITNIEGASEVISFSAVTYSNEAKIKMGVNEKTIQTYTVYSIEVAREMAKRISEIANSNIGIGITGKINREDIQNKHGENDKIYVSIYLKEENKNIDFEVRAIANVSREENKRIIIKRLCERLKEILK